MTGRNTVKVWLYLLGEVTVDDMCILRIHSGWGFKVCNDANLCLAFLVP